jgi:chitodextrinase
VLAQNSSTGEYLGDSTTDASGQYSLTVTQGPVRLYAERSNSTSPFAPAYWYLEQYFTVSGNVQRDIDLSLVRVSGVVTDSNGAPVANVTLSASGSFAGGFYGYYSSTITSAADGSYSLLAADGWSSFQIRPPQGSGFSQANLNLNLAGNLVQSIVLQRPDGTAPEIVAGPEVIHLSDDTVSIAWTTNEAATSIVQFGLGGLTANVTSTALVTEHSVTLRGLTPQQVYSFRVGSADKSGNGPTWSPLGYFGTQPPPGDVTAPVILSGPSVVFVDQTSAIVQWLTDEPSSTHLEHGATEALGAALDGPAGTFPLAHSVRIAGLSAETTYYFQVASTDPDGNTTTSAILSFTTLGVPDTQAPAIVEGPTISNVTDTRMTVSWRTDEPATSGVSYNDGITYHVVNDEGLVKEHSITLSGLRPQTTYHVTVSSKDAVFNGPTLAGPVDATTLSTADTTAPSIENVQVTRITTSSATITWTTDEPGTTLVKFGASQLDRQQADLSLVTTHEMTLTGLEERTTYTFTANSRDASGNAAASEPLTFETLSSVVDTPPTVPTALAASPNPTRTGAFVLSWGASTDAENVIARYEILRGGEVVGEVAGDVLTFDESGLGEGRYSYGVRAVDATDLSAESSSLEVVVDMTAPEVAVPFGVTVPASSPTDAVVTFVTSASDNVDANPNVACVPASGSTFGIGSTVVDCTSTDAAGNVGSASFVVTVLDVFAPLLTVPGAFSIDATGADGAVVQFAASAVDNHDPGPTVSCTPEPGTLLAIGVHTVTCTASDASGNVSPEATFVVTVRGGSDQIDSLMGTIAEWDLPTGLKRSLQAKLNAAMKATAAQTSCHVMGAFVHEVSAQAGKGLTAERAARLTTAAAQITAVLDCP